MGANDLEGDFDIAGARSESERSFTLSDDMRLPRLSDLTQPKMDLLVGSSECDIAKKQGCRRVLCSRVKSAKIN